MLGIQYLYAHILFNILSFVCIELYKISVYKKLLLPQPSQNNFGVQN